MTAMLIFVLIIMHFNLTDFFLFKERVVGVDL